MSLYQLWETWRERFFYKCDFTQLIFPSYLRTWLCRFSGRSLQEKVSSAVSIYMYLMCRTDFGAQFVFLSMARSRWESNRRLGTNNFPFRCWDVAGFSALCVGLSITLGLKGFFMSLPNAGMCRAGVFPLFLFHGKLAVKSSLPKS